MDPNSFDDETLGPTPKPTDSASGDEILEFGSFQAHVRARLLKRNGVPLDLTPRNFDLLLYFIQNPGRDISRDELLTKVWYDVEVSVNSLFRGISTLRKILNNEDGQDPILTVPRRGYRFVPEVTEVITQKVPVDVPVDDEVITSVVQPNAPKDKVSAAPVSRSGSRRNWYVLMGIIFTVIVIFGITSQVIFKRTVTPETSEVDTSLPEPPANPRLSAAVLGFKNLTGNSDTDWISGAISEMLVFELAIGDQVRVIPGKNVAHAKIDLALRSEPRYPPKVLKQLHTHLGSDLVVSGTYILVSEKADDSKLRIDLQVQEATTGRLVTTWSSTGSPSDLIDIVGNLGEHLREVLRIPKITPQQADNLKFLLPQDAQSARLFSEAIDHLRRRDPLQARVLLEEAVENNPEHPLLHKGLAETWSYLGYNNRAAESAKRAIELADGLPRENRLEVQALYHRTVNEWDRAAEISRTLWTFYPDNLEYALDLANDQRLSGRPDEALKVIEAVREFSPEASEGLRIDLVETNVRLILGDFEGLYELSDQLIQHAEERGSRRMAAIAARQKAAAAYHLDDLDTALDEFEAADRIFIELGDQMGQILALGGKGNVFVKQQEYEKARVCYEKVIFKSRQIGNRRGEAYNLSALGNLLQRMGDFKGAQESLEAAHSIFREIQDIRGFAFNSTVIASLMISAGDYAAAIPVLEESGTLGPRMGDIYVKNIVDSMIGYCHLQRGDLERGKEFAAQSLAGAGETGDPGLLFTTLSLSASSLFLSGDLEGTEAFLLECRELPGDDIRSENMVTAQLLMAKLEIIRGHGEKAREILEEALLASDSLADRTLASDCRVAQGRISLEEGQSSEAKRLALHVLEEAGQSTIPIQETAAFALLAEASLDLGQENEVQAAMDRALELSQSIQDIPVRLDTQIAIARVATRLGDHRKARGLLDGALAVATNAGLYGYQLEADLALGQLDLAAGAVNEGQDRLERVFREASESGYISIARKAAF